AHPYRPDYGLSERAPGGGLRYCPSGSAPGKLRPPSEAGHLPDPTMPWPRGLTNADPHHHPCVNRQVLTEELQSAGGGNLAARIWRLERDAGKMQLGRDRLTPLLHPSFRPNLADSLR